MDKPETFSLIGANVKYICALAVGVTLRHDASIRDGGGVIEIWLIGGRMHQSEVGASVPLPDMCTHGGASLYRSTVHAASHPPHWLLCLFPYPQVTSTWAFTLKRITCTVWIMALKQFTHLSMKWLFCVFLLVDTDVMPICTNTQTNTINKRTPFPPGLLSYRLLKTSTVTLLRDRAALQCLQCCQRDRVKLHRCERR